MQRSFQLVAATGAFMFAAAGSGLAQDQQQNNAQQNNAQQSNVQQGGAGEGCQVVNQELEREILANPEMRGGFSGGMTRDLRQMRDTAWRLDQYGQTEACNQVVSAMQEIIQNPDQYAEVSTGPAPGAVGTVGTVGAAGEEGVDREEMRQMQREEAVPLSEVQGQLRADNLIGTNVRGANDDAIGEVDDIILSSDPQSSYLVVSYGGFLGIGDDASAIPADQVQVLPNGDAVFVDMTESELEDAPTFDRGDYSWLQNDDWVQRNREFYGATGGNSGN